MGKIAFVFPGQGAQYIGMGKDIHDEFDVAKDVFSKASNALNKDVEALVFDSSEEELKLTENTQPAVLTTSIAILNVLLENGIKPDAVAGLSLGEYSALVAAGVLDFEEAVQIVQKRGKYMQEEVPAEVGGMAAILGLDKDGVIEACQEASSVGVVEPANYNCPGQIVIAGENEAVKVAVDYCKEKGAKRAIMLPVSAPFHTSLLEGAGQKLNKILKSIQYNDLNIPVVANAHGNYINHKDEVESLLTKQVSSPVLWEDSVQKLVDDGYDTFIEVGPGKSLGKFIKRVSRDVNILNVEDVDTLKKTLEKIK